MLMLNGTAVLRKKLKWRPQDHIGIQKRKKDRPFYHSTKRWTIGRFVGRSVGLITIRSMSLLEWQASLIIKNNGYTHRNFFDPQQPVNYPMTPTSRLSGHRNCLWQTQDAMETVVATGFVTSQWFGHVTDCVDWK